MSQSISASEFFDRALPASFVNAAAITVSLQSQIEGWLRVLSLVAAISYTGILIVKALRKPKP